MFPASPLEARALSHTCNLLVFLFLFVLVYVQYKEFPLNLENLFLSIRRVFILDLNVWQLIFNSVDIYLE